MSAIPDTKILCWDWFCVTTTGGCWPKKLTLGCRADMLLTCWQLSQPRSGNSGELQVLKKARPSKFCQHCKAKGGPHLTHNTKECRKYDGNGNPISSFQGKPTSAKKPARKGDDQQMAYLTAAVESLVKKGLKKAMKGKKRKRYDSSSNSDSE
jgi:hypothetical protein